MNLKGSRKKLSQPNKQDTIAASASGTEKAMKSPRFALGASCYTNLPGSKCDNYLKNYFTKTSKVLL
jgi:hypothetical protein